MFRMSHLFDRGVHVLGVRRGHRLHADGVLAADCDVADHHGASRPSQGLEDGFGVRLLGHCDGRRTNREVASCAVSQLPSACYMAGPANGELAPVVNLKNVATQVLSASTAL